MLKCPEHPCKNLESVQHAKNAQNLTVRPSKMAVSFAHANIAHMYFKFTHSQVEKYNCVSNLHIELLVSVSKWSPLM